MNLFFCITIVFHIQTIASRLATEKQPKTFINSNQCNITGFSFDSHITNKTIYSILLFLAKNKIQASMSLCQQFNMAKCDKICCEKSMKNYQQLRFICANNVENKKVPVNEAMSPPYTELQLCQKIQKSQCGQTCCISGRCDQKNNEKDKENLRYIDQICVQEKQQEELCNELGLLWCDGECCGFSSDRHRCFSVNHFGTPYIRCPKE